MKLLSDLETAVAIGKKYNINESDVLLLFFFESFVTTLTVKLIEKHGVEKFWAFFKEVADATNQGLSKAELEHYKNRFKHLEKLLERHDDKTIKGKG
jgi:hypothetical protein